MIYLACTCYFVFKYTQLPRIVALHLGIKHTNSSVQKFIMMGIRKIIIIPTLGSWLLHSRVDANFTASCVSDLDIS